MELSTIKKDLDKLLNELHSSSENVNSDSQNIDLEYKEFTICFSLESRKPFSDNFSSKNVIIYNAFIQFEDFETKFDQSYLTKIQNYLNQ